MTPPESGIVAQATPPSATVTAATATRTAGDIRTLPNLIASVLPAQAPLCCQSSGFDRIGPAAASQRAREGRAPVLTSAELLPGEVGREAAVRRLRGGGVDVSARAGRPGRVRAEPTRRVRTGTTARRPGRRA